MNYIVPYTPKEDYLHDEWSSASERVKQARFPTLISALKFAITNKSYVVKDGIVIWRNNERSKMDGNVFRP